MQPPHEHARAHARHATIDCGSMSHSHAANACCSAWKQAPQPPHEHDRPQARPHARPQAWAHTLGASAASSPPSHASACSYITQEHDRPHALAQARHAWAISPSAPNASW
jgi:hypothetical protein